MQKLDPKAVWFFFLSFFLKWFSIIFIFFFSIYVPFILDKGETSFGFLTRFLDIKWLWIIIPPLLIFSWIWAKLSYRFYRYGLREDGFRKESGVIYKRYVTIPYDRIQNVDIYRGILARILGLSDLRIQTAGMSAVVSSYGRMAGVGAEGRLPALSPEIAEQLRDELIQRARQLKTQGL